MREAFGKARVREKKLVASNLGLPLRRLWFSVKSPAKINKASDTIRFLYGNILEELVLLLAREAGHEVTEEQKRISVDGVTGKKDARIDEMVVDVKSASKFSFEKFKSGEFLIDDPELDPYGYKAQVGLYAKSDNDDKAAILAISKESGELAANVFDAYYDLPDVNLKIAQAKEALSRDEPPEEKCYPDVPRGKSGNMVLGITCTFCDFKEQCWKDANDGKGLIVHKYANSKAYFTKIVKEPRTFNEQSNEVHSSEEFTE
jgi:hypothetical protein